MTEREILDRLERLVDRWIKATPSERAMLLHEKIRLEDLLHDARTEAKGA